MIIVSNNLAPKTYKYKISGSVKVQIEAQAELSGAEIISALEHVKLQVLKSEQSESDNYRDFPSTELT